MNILVLRGGALGDFIVTLPALAALRRHWPDARLELIGNGMAAALATRDGLLDAVHSQHDGRWRALFGAAPLPADLSAWLGRFDVVVNYWPDPDGALARHFPIHPRQRFVSAAAMPTCAPAAAHYAEALRPLGCVTESYFVRLADLPGLRTRTTVTEPVAGMALPNAPISPGSDVIAVHPGSGSPRKNWPPERWMELMATLASPVLLIAGEAESETWNEPRLRRTALAPAIEAGRLRIAYGLSLEALATELQRCRLFLGHDSGVSHLAAACGVPCVLLFGPTDPAMWAPPAPHVRVLRHGPDLAAIGIDEVRDAMREFVPEALRER